ncbi:MAG: DUF262 domain-containing protein [Gemmatimonadota bacterium]|nr:DUF262 domain-containing protein [Gemmatimonadota bacterium]
MKARDESLTKLINGTVQFVIPVFQRDYKWTEDDCRQLWKDTVGVATADPDARHFIGSFVYKRTDDVSPVFSRWLMIDGQQRLTTVMLLLAALRDHLQASDWNGDDPTPDRIDRQLLRNVDEPDRRKLKLTLRRHDHSTFQAILHGTDTIPHASPRIHENYRYFRKMVATVDPRVLYQGIGRLVIVRVRLEDRDDAQMIFESLNSTGVELSQSDLIRNFILMQLSVDEQDRLYDTYWHKIELLFRGHEHVLDDFARDYVALKTRARKQGRATEVYREFRQFFPGFCDSQHDLGGALADMLRFAGYYAAFRLGRNAPEYLGRPLRRLRRLVDVPAIAVMQLFHYHDEAQVLSSRGFEEALALLESYVLRRAVCGHQTRGYWPVFAALAYGLDGTAPLDDLKVGLARQSDSYRFPRNHEFRRQLREQELYGKRVCRVILERLENHNMKERTDTQLHSIEHIMPQTDDLSRDWRDMLGRDDWRTVQMEWLHRLGNLTLTRYNSEYSDRSFEYKKTCKGGFEESAVRLNKFVRNQNVWTSVQMKERGDRLAGRAVDIWPDLQVAPELIERAKELELRERAVARSVDQVKMSAHARHLFRLLSGRTEDLGARVVEIAETRSVSYHAPDFFMEVLPREYRLVLLLSPDVAEMEDDQGMVKDATQWKYFRGSRYRGGVAVYVDTEEDVDRSMALVRQALVMTGG